ncbi:MAG: type II toxin-antitoxin system VapC family toxin [Terriglobales bacterium]
MKAYADTSFLVSLYSPDGNSAAAVETMRSAKGERYLTVWGELEMVNALELRVFRKELSAPQAAASMKGFAEDLASGIFQLRPLSDRVFERAHQLSRQTTARLGTRTADLVHVAAALELDADYLYSFDRQQRKLAQAVRLKLN